MHEQFNEPNNIQKCCKHESSLIELAKKEEDVEKIEWEISEIYHFESQIKIYSFIYIRLRKINAHKQIMYNNW